MPPWKVCAGRTGHKIKICLRRCGRGGLTLRLCTLKKEGTEDPQKLISSKGLDENTKNGSAVLNGWQCADKQEKTSNNESEKGQKGGDAKFSEGGKNLVNIHSNRSSRERYRDFLSSRNKKNRGVWGESGRLGLVARGRQGRNGKEEKKVLRSGMGGNTDEIHQRSDQRA